MAKTKITITADIKSPLDAPIYTRAIESILQYFTPAELSKVAEKLKQPIIRQQIKSML